MFVLQKKDNRATLFSNVSRNIENLNRALLGAKIVIFKGNIVANYNAYMK